MPRPQHKNIIFVLVLLLLVTGLAGCSSIHYRTKGLAPVAFSKDSSHQRLVSIQGKMEFYFFAQIPRMNELYVDEFVKERGHDGISRIMIEEKLTWEDLLWSLLSLGFYTPRTFIISGLVPGKAANEARDGDDREDETDF